MEKAKILSTMLIAFLILMLPLGMVTAQFSTQPVSLDLTVAVNKQTYSMGEAIQVTGTLTFNSTPVSAGLVGVQIQDPADHPLVVRTVNTGTVPVGPWVIEVLEILPTDSQGNIKTTFRRGEVAYFKVTLQNHDVGTNYSAWVTVNAFDSAMVPQGVPRVQGVIPKNAIFEVLLSLPITTLFATGPAIAYANAFKAQPLTGGMPYSPEKSATFTVVSSLAMADRASQKPSFVVASPGSYQFTFTMLPTYARLGNYTVAATSQYQVNLVIYLAADSTQFEVVMYGDLNGDLVVDIFDIVIVAVAFGSVPGMPNWNPIADAVKDDVIDIFDLVVVALDYGRIAQT